MKQPNEYWLKYMLVFVSSDYAQIANAAKLYEFAVPDKAYVTSLLAKLDETKPNPFRLDTLATKNWLRRQRLMSMGTGGKDAMLAREYLSEAKVRSVLETLIIADTPREDIPEYVKEITGRKTTVEAVKLFEHYYWNRNLLSHRQWMDYLDDRSDRWLLLNSYDQGHEYALWKLGYRIQTSQEELVDAMLHEAAMRYLETRTMVNGEKTALTAKMWSEVVFKSIEEKDKKGDQAMKVAQEIREIAIKLEKASIKSIKELTGGSYSKAEGKST